MIWRWVMPRTKPAAMYSPTCGSAMMSRQVKQCVGLLALKMACSSSSIASMSIKIKSFRQFSNLTHAVFKVVNFRMRFG